MSAHSEFLALLATLPSGAPAYNGTVPDYDDAPPMPVFELPYVLVTSFVPRVGERSLSRSVHSHVERWRTRVSGETSDSVRIIASQVVRALEGARISGHRLERVPDDFPIWEDEDIVLPGTGKNPHYTIIEWRVTT